MADPILRRSSMEIARQVDARTEEERLEDALSARRACRACGCTGEDPCVTLDGSETCAWTEPDLCSACLGA